MLLLWLLLLFTSVIMILFTILSVLPIKLFFSPVVPASKSYTVAIIKPDAVAHGKANEIIMKVHRH